MCVFSRSVMSDFVTSWTVPWQAPLPKLLWGFPGKNAWVGCHSFLWGIFSTQWSTLHFLLWQVDSLPLTHLGMVTLPVCACGSVMSYSLGPLGFNSPSYTVRMIFQARILEWVAVFSSRGSFRPRDWTLVSCVPCFEGRFFTCWVKLNKHSLFFFPLFEYQLVTISWVFSKINVMIVIGLNFIK